MLQPAFRTETRDPGSDSSDLGTRSRFAPVEGRNECRDGAHPCHGAHAASVHAAHSFELERLRAGSIPRLPSSCTTECARTTWERNLFELKLISEDTRHRTTHAPETSIQPVTQVAAVTGEPARATVRATRDHRLRTASPGGSCPATRPRPRCGDRGRLKLQRNYLAEPPRQAPQLAPRFLRESTFSQVRAVVWGTWTGSSGSRRYGFCDCRSLRMR